MKRRYFRWGLYGGLGLPALFATAIAARAAFAYDGQCGGLMPFLAGPRPCPFWEHISGTLHFTGALLWDAFWPLVLAVLVIPPAVGYVFDRRAHDRDA